MKLSSVLSIATAVLLCHHSIAYAQGLYVTIEQNDFTVVPEAGIQLTADATPSSGSSAKCLLFDWSDPDGDWGAGTVTGLQSNLMYYPEGNLYGTTPVITCTVTDADGNTSVDDTVDLIVPDITPGTSDLSYYDGYSDGVFNVGSKSGGAQSTLRVRINPDPTESGTIYIWTVAGTGGAITLSPDADTIHCDIIGCGASTGLLDQDAQLIGPDGNTVADKKVTVHYPSSSKPFGSVLYATDDTVYPLLGTAKGWETDYTMQLLDSMGYPMPDGAPNNESFDSWTGGFYWIHGYSPSDSTSAGPLPDCSGGNGTFADNYVYPGLWSHVPTGLHIGDPGCDDIAASCTYQHYASGSNTAGEGVETNKHTLNIRRGHATQD